MAQDAVKPETLQATVAVFLRVAATWAAVEASGRGSQTGRRSMRELLTKITSMALDLPIEKSGDHMVRMRDLAFHDVEPSVADFLTRVADRSAPLKGDVDEYFDELRELLERHHVVMPIDVLRKRLGWESKWAAGEWVRSIRTKRGDIRAAARQLLSFIGRGRAQEEARRIVEGARVQLNLAHDPSPTTVLVLGSFGQSVTPLGIARFALESLGFGKAADPALTALTQALRRLEDDDDDHEKDRLTSARLGLEALGFDSQKVDAALAALGNAHAGNSATVD
jgi:hypothetical protein